MRRDTRKIAPSYEPNVIRSATASVTEQAWDCQYCGGVTIELLFFVEVDRGRKVAHIDRVWPKKTLRALDPSVPAAVRDLFAEGSQCESVVAYRAAAVLYRATVEEMVKDRGAEGHNLYNKIEDLKNRGITEEIVRDLHEARMLGNDSIHYGLTYSPEEVADVAELIAEVAQILYVEPAQRAAMRNARKQRRDAAKT